MHLIVTLGVLTIIVGWLIFCRISSRNARTSQIDMICRSEEGTFSVKGDKRIFTIRKEGDFEFLVRDGNIVAVKDHRRSSEFVFYGGDGVD